MLTPNKLNYATCPHCKTFLDQMHYVPMSALANPHYVFSVCPACQEEIEVRVYVTFTVEVNVVTYPED
jgi:hypothetical protein